MCRRETTTPLVAKYGLVLTLLISGWGGVGCRSQSQPALEVPSSANPSPAAPPVVAAQPTVTRSPAIDPVTAFRLGRQKAAGALSISQSAQSQDDWKLVVNRWQQAIDLLQAIPAISDQYVQAQALLVEYEHQLSRAQQQAARPTQTAPPPQTEIVVGDPSQPVSADGRDHNTSVGAKVFQAKIKRRDGGTPIIEVMFNGKQPFEMIVDTGASGTVITQRMATTLGVTPTGYTQVDTVSQKGIRVPLGTVRSMEVNGMIVKDVKVAIAGTELGIGLLGHDFFGSYDITVKQDVVEFRTREASPAASP